MHLSSHGSRIARPFLPALLLGLAFAPGCELATHFGDFQQGSTDANGSDGGGLDAGDTGPRDAGHDSAIDANVDAPIDFDATLPDAGDTGVGGDSGVVQRHVRVTLAGAGGGMVDAMGGALVCTSGSCDWTVDDGTSLTLHAAPNATSTLASWGGACATTTVPGDCALTVTSDVNVTATFDVLQVHVTVMVSNPPGTVTATTPTINCDGTAGSTCTGTVAAGTSVTLRAAPTLPNTDVAWAGATCTGTTCTFTANADITITVTFSDGRPVLDVTETGHGTVATADGRINCINGGTDCSEIYDPGTSVTLTATPETGYTFTSWTGCDSSPTPTTCTVSLADGAHVTVAATFTINHYNLTVNVAGTDVGTVTSSTPMLTCSSADGTCNVTGVAYGTMVTLTATPMGNARFQSWSGVSGCDTNAMCTFTMTADVNATATFVTDTRIVTVVIAGGDGQITSSSAPFNCTYSGGSPTAGSTCTATLPLGSSFDLGVIPHAGYHVTSWVSNPAGIGCTGSLTSCTGSVVRAISASGGTVTVNLAATLYTLDVIATAATGSGSIQTMMGGTTLATCNATAAGNDCAAMYTYGTMLTLHPVPGGSSLFLGWSGGGCSGTGDCTVTVDAAKSVTGSFAIMSTLLQVNTTGATTGTVTSTSPAGAINCGSTCSATFSVGQMVTLHASAATGYNFNGWTGGGCSGTGDCTLSIVSGANLVYAEFIPIPETLTVSLQGTGSGTVTDDPSFSRIDCTGFCTANYDYGTVVTLTAVANSTSVFVSWMGCTTTTGNTCTVRMDAAKTVRATFNVATAPLSVTPSGNGSGHVASSDGQINCNQPSMTGDSCTGTYSVGQMMSLYAGPALHSHVAGWMGCSSVSADMLTCTVNAVPTGGVVVTPIFALDTFTVSVALSPTGLGSASSSDSYIACPSGSCSHVYDYGASVVLSAAPSGTNIFSGWTGVTGCGGTSSSCSFTVTGDVAATANFVAGHALTVVIPMNSQAAGSRVFLPGGTTCTTSATTSSSCSVDVPSGLYVLTADSQPDWLGAIWSGVSGCSGPTCHVAVNTADVTVTVTWGQTGNIMFVTSMTYSGLLGGISGADTQCQNRAASAGLPGTYRAWLSTTSVAAMSRLGSTDSMWVRVDGRPIAASRAMLLGGALIHPIALDENGMPQLSTSLPATTNVWTGTTSSGTLTSGASCSDWTSSGSTGMPGLTTATAINWTNTVSPIGCSQQAHLYCTQIGASVTASALPLVPSDAVYIFTSSHTGNGAITLATMDADCAMEASNAMLPGTYRALVSSSSSNAFDRATLYGTLTRPDGWPIGPHSASSSILWFPPGPVLAVWGQQADRTLIGGSPALDWTGMGANATGTGATCSNWTSSATSPTVGVGGYATSVAPGYWAGYANQGCDTVSRWYCIQYGP